MINKLSPTIVVKLGDNSIVTATHYGFVNVIQGYEDEALHSCTFQLSLQSIIQLDLGENTTTFWNRKRIITLPSSCNVAGKLINAFYINVPVTPLLLLTSMKMKETDS
jgi:hypothetical protein